MAQAVLASLATQDTAEDRRSEMTQRLTDLEQLGEEDLARGEPIPLESPSRETLVEIIRQLCEDYPDFTYDRFMLAKIRRAYADLQRGHEI